jgi:hypothetical protein
MILTGRTRKLALAVHLMCSVGWIGAVLAYLALGVAATASVSDETVRGAWVAMELIGWFVLVPLALGSLLTGAVMALGTKWGLFRYYWVLFAFVLTTLATLVLVFHMPAVSSSTDQALDADAAGQELGGDLFHASLGLGVLLVILVLNVNKPPGMTRYGWRRQNQRAGDDARPS